MHCGKKLKWEKRLTEGCYIALLEREPGVMMSILVSKLGSRKVCKLYGAMSSTRGRILYVLRMTSSFLPKLKLIDGWDMETSSFLTQGS